MTASGDEPITVELVHADFGFGDDYQVVLINDDAPETTAFSTRNWFSLRKPRYRIPAGATRDLPLRISVPDNTPGGTYLGAALLRVVPPDDVTGASQIQAVAQIGPLVFIAVEGGDPPKPKIDEFSVDRRTTSGPIMPDIVIGNDGDEFFTVEGTVKLTGPGKDSAAVIRRQYVVPDEPRSLQASAAGGAGDSGPIKLGSSKLGFGKYTVTTRLRVEPTGTTLVAHRTVWVIPIWTRLLGLGLLVVALILVALIVRRVVARDASPEVHPIISSDRDSFDDDSLDDEPFDEDELGEASRDEDLLEEDLLDEDSRDIDEDSDDR